MIHFFYIRHKSSKGYIILKIDFMFSLEKGRSSGQSWHRIIRAYYNWILFFLNLAIVPRCASEIWEHGDAIFFLKSGSDFRIRGESSQKSSHV